MPDIPFFFSQLFFARNISLDQGSHQQTVPLTGGPTTRWDELGSPQHPVLRCHMGGFFIGIRVATTPNLGKFQYSHIAQHALKTLEFLRLENLSMILESSCKCKWVHPWTTSPSPNPHVFGILSGKATSHSLFQCFTTLPMQFLSPNISSKPPLQHLEAASSHPSRGQEHVGTPKNSRMCSCTSCPAGAAPACLLLLFLDTWDGFLAAEPCWGVWQQPWGCGTPGAAQRPGLLSSASSLHYNSLLITWCWLWSYLAVPPSSFF